MKHSKKRKKRGKASDQVIVGRKVTADGDNEEHRVLNSLIEAFDSVSLEQASSAYKEANGDANKAAVILGGLLETPEDRSSTSTACSSSSGSSGFCSDVFVDASCDRKGVYEKFSRGSKPKKVVASAGTVSTLLGKDYVRSTPKKDSLRSKGFKIVEDGDSSKDDMEQFLCSMLGEECELSMAVVRDVLCQCGFDVEKALNILLELSASSSEQVKNSQYDDFSGNIREDTQFIPESSDSLTGTSDSASHSSESDLQENFWSVTNHPRRNYSNVLAGFDAHLSTSQRSSNLELPQKVLEYLFNMPTPKGAEHEPNTMNWRNVMKKMESMAPRLDFCPSGNAESPQHTNAEGAEYQVFRKDAKQHYDSMKSYYQKAATAYSSGHREYAAYLSEQGRLQSRRAREADEKASQNIFNARNKRMGNVVTIDLHGQHVKQAMKLLKLHLLFGAYLQSVQSFRVITGCGSHGVGKSKLKQSVIGLLEKEGIAWSEENRGTLLIKLDGQTEFGFLDADSDGE